jgi:hypothetical protein
MSGKDKPTDLDVILGRLNSMNLTLLQCQDDIKACNTNIKSCNENLESTIIPRLTAAEAEIHNLKHEVCHLKKKQTELENYMKRDNLIFGGINEKTPDKCEEQVRYIISTKMNIDASEIKFQRVHRIGKKVAGKSRPIIARFLWFPDRQSVWKARRELNGTNFWISEDFTKDVQESRKTLRPILQAAIVQASDDNPVSAYLVLDRLYINDKMYTVDNLRSLPPSLQPEALATPLIGDDYVAFYNQSSPFSNFYASKFQLEGKVFEHVEQYFQFKKAQICGNQQLAVAIANETSPYASKQLSKQVKPTANWKKDRKQ